MQTFLKAKYITYIFLICIVAAFTSCSKSGTQKQLVYFNDFEDDSLYGIRLFDAYGPISYNKIFTYNGSKVLGHFNNNLFVLEVSGMPEHNSLNISFTLNIHDKWNGDFLFANSTPDLWIMKFMDNITLLTTFSNLPAYKQSYPGFYASGAPSYPAKAMSENSNLPALCSFSGTSGTSSYEIVKTIPHTAKTFKLDCSDAIQSNGDSCMKSWSIDNLRITAITY